MAAAARGMGQVLLRGGGRVLSRLARREDEALTGQGVREFDRLFPGVKDINPNFSSGGWGFQNNCQSCVVATDHTLAGRPAQALERPLVAYHPAFDWPSSVTSTVGTGPLHRVADYAAIDQEMLAAGDGARGIVHGARTDAAGQYMSGHVFNVVNRDGVIHYIDGQTGDFAVKESFGWMELIRTN